MDTNGHPYKRPTGAPSFMSPQHKPGIIQGGYTQDDTTSSLVIRPSDTSPANLASSLWPGQVPEGTHMPHAMSSEDPMLLYTMQQTDQNGGGWVPVPVHSMCITDPMSSSDSPLYNNYQCIGGPVSLSMHEQFPPGNCHAQDYSVPTGYRFLATELETTADMHSPDNTLYLRLTREEEKPGHDPPYGQWATNVPDLFNGNMQMAVDDPSVAMSHSPTFKGHGHIAIREYGTPKNIPVVQIYGSKLQKEFLEFMTQNCSLLCSVSTPSDVAAIEPIMCAFEEHMSHRGLEFHKADMQQVFSQLKRVGTGAGRRERNTKKKADTKEICPFPFCHNPFTRKSGLKHHISAHFRLAPCPCLLCGKSFPAPSIKRHESTCKGIRKMLSGLQ